MANVNIKVNTDNSGVQTLRESLDELKKSLIDVKNSMGEVIESNKKVNTSTSQTDKSMEDLSTVAKVTSGSLAELTQRQAELREAFENTKIGTDQWKAYQKELTNVTQKIANYELQTEALDNEKMASEMKSVAGGVAELAGGFEYLGLSSGTTEQIAQGMAKIEGTTKALTGTMEAFSSGVKIINSLQSKKITLDNVLIALNLKKATAETADAAAIGTQATATGVANTATKAWNVTLLANPIFLMVAVLAAVVAGLAIFASKTRDTKGENDKLNSSLESQIDIQDRLNAKREKNAQYAIDLLKAQGKSSQEIYEAEKKLLKTQEEDRVSSLNVEKKGIEDKRKLYYQALEDENYELAKSINDEIKQHRSKYNTLLDAQGDYQKKSKLLKIEFDNTTKEEEDKKTEEEKQRQKTASDNYKKYLADKKAKEDKYNADRLNAQRTQEDLDIDNMNEGVEKEIKLNETKYKRLIADTISNKDLLGKVEMDANGNLISGEGEKYEKVKSLLIAKNIKEIDIIDKDNKEKLDKEKEFQDQLLALQDTGYKTQQQKNQEAYDESIADFQKQLEDKLITQEQYNQLEQAAKTKLNNDNAAADQQDEFNKTQNKINQMKDGFDKQMEQEKLNYKQLLAANVGNNEETERIGQEHSQKLKDIDSDEKKQKVSNALNMANMSMDATKAGLQGIADLVNAYAGKSEAAQRKAFNITKKLNIAMSVIDTIKGGISAFNGMVSSIPGPVGIALGAVAAAGVVASGVASIKKIQATKFESASTSAASSSTSSSLASSLTLTGNSTNMNDATGTKSVESTVAQNTNNNNTNNQTVNVKVGVDEITTKQNKVNKIVDSGTL